MIHIRAVFKVDLKESFYIKKYFSEKPPKFQKCYIKVTFLMFMHLIFKSVEQFLTKVQNIVYISYFESVIKL